MRNLAVTIRYNGSNYHGWQVQKNALTVQEVFQNSLERIIGERPDVKGCSRTDTGVHAYMYVINFMTENKIKCEQLIKALNFTLPPDIAAYDCCEKKDDFHARYSCKGKQYIYKILNSYNRDPFYQSLAYHYGLKLDEEIMDKAAKNFIGTYDFSAFCSSGSKVKDHVRTVTQAEVKRDGDLILFTVTADGFLYNMVRIMAGTLIETANGHISPDDMGDIILSGDRSRAGMTAPPEGLYLNRVYY